MKKLTENIKKDAPIHGSIPFWSWNDKLKEDELRRQIRNMKSFGMRGFFMHARGGLETEYMSKEWFDAVEICIDEAKKLGMEAWAYDENGWPSGFAGGELLKDPRNFAKSVNIKEVASFPQNYREDENILGVYTVNGDKLSRVESDCGSEKYYIIVREFDFSYVDTLDGEVTDKFIASTHEIYKKNLENKGFGKEMPGFFTDEPQYFRWGTPWSDTFFESFKARFGYDVLEGLPHLFIDGLSGGEEFRYDYRLLCHEQFYSNFVKKIYDWCDANGVQLTGHAVEEWGLGGQMMCCGGVMPFYLYEHIPGIDYLGRGINNISAPKQLGSVCAQTGKKVAMSEMYACCGWDVSPRELKRIAELQYAGGVNLTCEHLYAYSERGQRKRDYPNHYSDHNPWQKYYGEYAKYFRNLGSALSQGDEYADTLVIHPIRTAYFYYPRNMGLIESKYSQLVDDLTRDHVAYHFGDETIMRDMGCVEGDKIRVGKCVYNKIIIPYTDTLDKSTAELLKKYLANGGKLTLWGKVPERIDGRLADTTFIKENLPYSELAKISGLSVTKSGENIPVKMQIRNIDGEKLIFLANTSGNEYLNTEITIPDAKGAMRLDISSLRYSPVRGRKNSDGSVTVFYDFTDSESCLLVTCDSEMLPYTENTESIKAPTVSLGKFTLADLPENTLLLDSAQISKDGEEFTEERPIIRIRDNLLRERYCGKLSMKFNFMADVIPKSALIVVEPLKYSEITVNGVKAEFTEGYRIDRSFRTVDVSKLLKIGENSIVLTFDYYQKDYVYKVLYGGGNEALRNCLAFDSEIEPIYLYGDFGVKPIKTPENTDENARAFRIAGPFKITSRNENIEIRDIVRDGYPFFAGEMTVKSTVNYKNGDPTLLCLGGRFAVSKVSINGTDLGAKLFSDKYELKDFLHEGENELIITLCFSNRNLLGPHNREELEPTALGPITFSFENAWDGENCPGFVYDKAFVRFGIDF